MKVTIWNVSDLGQSCGYCFWTKKEAFAFVHKNAFYEEYGWSIEKEVIEGSTRHVCSELVNTGIECAGGHVEDWMM